MHCSDQKNYSSNSLEHAIKLYVHVPERNNYNAQGKQNYVIIILHTKVKQEA